MIVKTMTQLRNKAKRSLEAAKDLHEKGYYDFAISRVYYAMFYIAEALLLIGEKEFSSHSALISGFHQSYIQTGLLQRKYHSYLDEAYDLREEADYDWKNMPSKVLSQRQIQNAEEFLKETERFFKE